MGRYDSHKNPFAYRMSRWSAIRNNDTMESMPKSIPAYVSKIEKDFVHVMFEPANGIFTMPVVKMTQSFSRFGREPTQQKDKGLAVPGDYYIGGNTGFAGGGTNFYPRANLSSLSFQPLANLNAPPRDYDTHWETGGPNGWLVKVMEDQQQSQGQQNGGTSTGVAGSGPATVAMMSRATQQIMQRTMAGRALFAAPAPLDSSSSAPNPSSPPNGQSNQQQNDKTLYSFDKNGMCTVQSKDTDHQVVADQQNQRIYLKVPKDETIFVGGDGKDGVYAQLVTTQGPVINAKGRIG